MKIKKINYYSVPRCESAICSCCGQGIMNICAVTSIEGETFLFGTTCFGKLMKDRLTSFQRKEMNKALKSIKIYEEQKLEWKEMTEEKYREKIGEWAWENNRYYGDDYEDCKTFEDYKTWMLEHFFPYRMDLAEKELEKFRRIDF